MPGGGTWGTGAWGGGAWVGGGVSLALTLAWARRENCIRLQFNEPVYLSDLLDEFDASRPELFTVTAVTGTVGLDGLPARAVAPATVAYPDPLNDPVATPATFNTMLDVWLDRKMSPYPAAYVVTCQGLAGDPAGATLLDPGQSSFQLLGVQQDLVPPTLDPIADRGGDFANPSTLSAAQAAKIPNAGPTTPLGTYLADGTGAYARDRGIESYKKRIVRAVLARRGAFIHLPTDWGGGLAGMGKALATRARVEQAQSAILQIVQSDPETAQARVMLLLEPTGVWRVSIVARLRSGPVIKFGTQLSPQ